MESDVAELIAFSIAFSSGLVAGAWITAWLSTGKVKMPPAWAAISPTLGAAICITVAAVWALAKSAP